VYPGSPSGSSTRPPPGGLLQEDPRAGAARALLGVPGGARVVALVPASRQQELRLVWPVLLGAAEALLASWRREQEQRQGREEGSQGDGRRLLSFLWRSLPSWTCFWSSAGSPALLGALFSAWFTEGTPLLSRGRLTQTEKGLDQWRGLLSLGRARGRTVKGRAVRGRVLWWRVCRRRCTRW